jgi:hypothetical protein
MGLFSLLGTIITAPINILTGEDDIEDVLADIGEDIIDIID